MLEKNEDNIFESEVSLTLVPPNYTVPYEQVVNFLCGWREKFYLWVSGHNSNPKITFEDDLFSIKA